MGWHVCIEPPPTYGYGPPEFGSTESSRGWARACTARRRSMHAHTWEVAPLCAVVTPGGERLAPGTVVTFEHFEKLVQLGVVLESESFSEPEPPRAA